MLIDTQKLYSKKNILKFNGQICVDGIETFLVKEDGNGSPRYFLAYGRREEVFEQVKSFYGERLNSEIDKLVLAKAGEVRQAKKNLALLKKADKIKLKNKK